CFFFPAEDGIRVDLVTGVQTCALPIFRSMERVERSHESEVVVEILPRSRHVALPECSLVRRHDLLCIRHSSRSSGNAGASCHAAKIGPPGMRNQKKLPIPGMSTRGRTIAPPALSVLVEAASRSSTRT